MEQNGKIPTVCSVDTATVLISSPGKRIAASSNDIFRECQNENGQLTKLAGARPAAFEIPQARLAS